ncbi:extracellular serine-rich protein [Colletotrichum truncatum]|uniref:Extracellular serine-rich protein n=1 Tax=Colletotrichum truncatum TaxID=5467 RepID=A0ACC3Z542_COLTU|nr:extracellular serine-rich protein [Colletotrichum truncatum]KAF6795075.1 extracellular serine-rich protein [Colletotrichum truncatum]
MFFSSIVGIAGLVMLVKAQSTTSTDPVTPTPFYSTITTLPTRTATARATATGDPMTHTIAVGASGFSFSPARVRAQVGDTIEWIFYPDGHSVVRAEYGFPCTPYEYIDIGRAGFYSGPQPVKAITNDMPRYRVRVNDTDPIFFYCGAPGSCYKEKMIGVINEVKRPAPLLCIASVLTLDGQLDAALPLTTQILPGEPFPTESDPAKGGNVINNFHHSLSGGAIAGIVIGCAAFLLFGGLIVYLCGRRGGFDRAYRRATMAYHPASPPGAGSPPVTEINYTAQPKNPSTQAWRNSHYSQVSTAYHDQAAPLANFPGVSPPTSPQPIRYPHAMNGMQQAYYDHRVSSIAPSVAPVEVPDNQAVIPPAPEAPPAELPVSENSSNSTLPVYQKRLSLTGKESEYAPNKELV